MKRLRGIVVLPLLLAGCSRSGHVAVPADDASPQDVVRAYVAAVNAKDCTTAITLAPGDSWCGRARLDELRLTSTTDQTREGNPSRKVKYVAVQFTLHGGDGSMPDGPHGWGYLLDRTGPQGAWRIYDQGVG